ncbi:Factor of DNA methylation 1 [Linum perenne]
MSTSATALKVPGDVQVEMEKGHNEEQEELLMKANEVIRSLTEELQTKIQELAELRLNYADTTGFANRMITQLVEKLRSRDTTILDLEQKYEDISALAKCLEFQKDQMEDYYIREIKNMKATIIQLDYKMEFQEYLKQQVEEKEEQLTRQEEACTSILNQMEKLKESMEVEKLECTRTSNEKYEALREKLEEKEETLQYSEDLNRALMVKELAANQELQDARKKSISGLQEVMIHHHRSSIGIKRMGEIKGQVFREACLGRFSMEELDDASAKLCSLWEQHLTDPHWHPFKHQCIQDQQQEVIDEDDEKLKQLRNEYGKVAYDAVTKALMELNEYNPSGRYPVHQVWNFKEERKATMKEIVHFLINQLKTHKRKRKRR